MNPATPALNWLRRGLAAFSGLLALAVTCGLIWGVLAALGDEVGVRAFRWITFIVAIVDAVYGVALLIGTTWSVIRLIEQGSNESPTNR